MLKLFSLVIGLASFTCGATAGTITIGTAANINTAPFGSVHFVPGVSSDRYQQVWDSSSFAGLGPIDINTIQFQVSARTPVPTRNLTYTLSLSTTSVAVNGLNVDRTYAGYDSNLGANNSIFNSGNSTGGSPGSVLSFGGSHRYDPSKGNLLLDIVLNGGRDTGIGFHVGYGFGGVAATSASGGLFSRSYWGNGFDNYGVIATFQYTPISQVPLPAGLPLLASGLALFGFTSLRRKHSRS